MSTTTRIRKWWTEKEDELLRVEAELQLNETNQIKDWNRVAAKLPGRTNKDCRKRWSKVSENVNKGAWSRAEDERLQKAVERYGFCWIDVARSVRSRHADQCAKRWQHYLDPSVDRSDWQERDDERLIAAVDKYGRNWKTIGDKVLHGRSATDLKNRFVILERKRSLHNNPQSSADDDEAEEDDDEEDEDDDDEDDDSDFPFREPRQRQKVASDDVDMGSVPDLASGSSSMSLPSKSNLPSGGGAYSDFADLSQWNDGLAEIGPADASFSDANLHGFSDSLFGAPAPSAWSSYPMTLDTDGAGSQMYTMPSEQSSIAVAPSSGVVAPPSGTAFPHAQPPSSSVTAPSSTAFPDALPSQSQSQWPLSGGPSTFRTTLTIDDIQSSTLSKVMDILVKNKARAKVHMSNV